MRKCLPLTPLCPDLVAATVSPPTAEELEQRLIADTEKKMTELPSPTGWTFGGGRTLLHEVALQVDYAALEARTLAGLSPKILWAMGLGKTSTYRLMMQKFSELRGKGASTLMGGAVSGGFPFSSGEAQTRSSVRQRLEGYAMRDADRMAMLYARELGVRGKPQFHVLKGREHLPDRALILNFDQLYGGK